MHLKKYFSVVLDECNLVWLFFRMEPIKEEVSDRNSEEECIVYDLDKDVYRRKSCQGNHSVICAASGEFYHGFW